MTRTIVYGVLFVALLFVLRLPAWIDDYNRRQTMQDIMTKVKDDLKRIDEGTKKLKMALRQPSNMGSRWNMLHDDGREEQRWTTTEEMVKELLGLTPANCEERWGGVLELFNSMPFDEEQTLNDPTQKAPWRIIKRRS
jgi:hypothetical protein